MLEPESLAPQPDPEILSDPLGFILAEHYRQRVLCDRLDAMTEEHEVDPVASHAAELLSFLKQDLALHTADEEQDLFPLLRKRCPEDDGIDSVLSQLSAEHELDQDLVEFMIDDLELLAGGLDLANPVRFLVNAKELATTQRRHLSWENRTVLPIARRRLTNEDLVDLGRAMAARRGMGSNDS